MVHRLLIYIIERKTSSGNCRGSRGGRFLFYFIYVLERGEGRKKERERNIDL